MEKRYQVFVSSTFADLQEERQEIIQALLELDCIPAGMELFPAADDDQWTLIKKVIDDCDYYIVVIAGRYGSLSPSGVGYTHMEYEYAVSQGKPVIAFLHRNPGSIPSDKTEQTEDGRRRLAAFRELVQKKMCKYWSSPSELGSVVSRSLVKLIKDKPAVGWVRATSLPIEPVPDFSAPLRETQPVVEPEDTNLKKLHQNIVERDKKNISKVVRIVEHSISYTNLTAQVPSIDFIFEVFNGSVFDISVDEKLGGFIHLNNNAMVGDKGIVGHVEELLRGEVRTLVIKQYVNPREAELILDATEQDEFRFGGLQVVIKGNADCPDVVWQRLTLPYTVTVRLPQAAVEKLKGRIKELEATKEVAAKEVEHFRAGAAKLQHLAETHSIRASLRDQEREAHQWLYDIADTQKGTIDDYVVLEKCTLGDMKLDHPVPSVRFGLYITNHSVFDITVEVEQGGGILFGDYRLNTYPLKVLYNDLVDAPCGKNGCVTIEQPLRKEEATYIAESENKAYANFYFDGLVITIKGGQNFPQVSPKRLVVTKGVHISGEPLVIKSGVASAEDKLIADRLRQVLGSIQIKKVECDSKELFTGQVIHISLVITNEAASFLEVWIGASLVGPSESEYYDTSQDKPVRLEPGTHTYNRSLTVPGDVPSGECSLYCAVWLGQVSRSKQSIKLDKLKHEGKLKIHQK